METDDDAKKSRKTWVYSPPSVKDAPAPVTSPEFSWHQAAVPQNLSDFDRKATETCVAWALKVSPGLFKLEISPVSHVEGGYWSARDSAGNVVRLRRERFEEATMNPDGRTVFNGTAHTVLYERHDGEFAGSHYEHWYEADGTECKSGYDGIKVAVEHALK